MLIPHSHCKNAGKDLYEEYKVVRGPVAIEKDELLTIDASSSNQPCSTFGIHPKLPIVQNLYQKDMALFLANVGFLTSSVTKQNWRDTIARLFAHDSSKYLNHIFFEQLIQQPDGAF